MAELGTTRVQIWTDGACSGNPGPGGWGALLRYGEVEKELCGGETTPTTNNRMELTAPIRALTALTRASVVDLYTDSPNETRYPVWHRHRRWPLPGPRARDHRRRGPRPLSVCALPRARTAACPRSRSWCWCSGACRPSCGRTGGGGAWPARRVTP